MNSWMRVTGKNFFGNEQYAMTVPQGLPAPRCMICGKECRDVLMTMIGWDAVRFDGFHFAHKFPCLGNGRDLPYTAELSSTIETPGNMLTLDFAVLDMVEENSPLPLEVRQRTGETLSWVRLMGLHSMRPSAAVYTSFARGIRDFVAENWLGPLE